MISPHRHELPVLDEMPPSPRPWHVALGSRAIAVNQLGSISADRLLKRTERSEFETLRKVRLVVRQITGAEPKD